jgi:small subunit ribosomal protein S21
MIKKHNNQSPASEYFTGLTVYVHNDNFNAALRKFKRKVDDSGILIETVKRSHYEKPSVKRRRAKGAARSRWLKKERKLRSDN